LLPFSPTSLTVCHCSLTSICTGCVKLCHHSHELLKLDLSVAILIYLLNDSVYGLSGEGVGAAEAEHLSDFVGRDDSRAVLIEHAESGVQLLLRGQVLLASGSDDELSIVDESTVVRVHSSEHRLNLLVAHDSAVVLQVALLDLFHAELTVTVLVEGLEDLGQIVAFILAHQLRGNERERSLFEGDITVELAKVVKGGHGSGLVNLKRSELGDPWVLKGLLSGWALLGVVGQQGADEAFAVLRDGLPDAVIKVELALAHLFHDILVGLSIEGRHAGEKNIRDHTRGPDVALMVVVLVEDLRSDVIGSTELLVEVTVGVVHQGGTEIDDLDLVELFVLLKQDILRLQVAMHDVGLMAVVDA